MRAGTWTDAALGFLGRHTGHAAAAWLSFAEPGPPYAVPPPYDFLFALDEVEPMSSPYFSMILVPGEKWRG